MEGTPGKGQDGNRVYLYLAWSADLEEAEGDRGVPTSRRDRSRDWLASLRDADGWGRWSGGIVASLLNRRPMAVNPPGSCRLNQSGDPDFVPADVFNPEGREPVANTGSRSAPRERMGICGRSQFMIWCDATEARWQ